MLEQKAFQDGIEKGKVEGIKEGELKGKWKGEVKGEIKQIKSLLKYKVEPEKIKEELKFLNHEKNIGKFDLNFQYIQDHIDETESQIMGGMDIEMDY